MKSEGWGVKYYYNRPMTPGTENTEIISSSRGKVIFVLTYAPFLRSVTNLYFMEQYHFGL